MKSRDYYARQMETEETKCTHAEEFAQYLPNRDTVLDDEPRVATSDAPDYRISKYDEERRKKRHAITKQDQ